MMSLVGLFYCYGVCCNHWLELKAYSWQKYVCPPENSDIEFAKQEEFDIVNSEVLGGGVGHPCNSFRGYFDNK